MSRWKQYNGDYDKKFYDIKLKSGVIVPECWPNAGTFHVCGTHSDYNKGDVIEGKHVAFIRPFEGADAN